MLSCNSHKTIAKLFYIRKYTHKNQFEFIPHQITMEEAINIFNNYDSNRIFKPLTWTNNDITKLKKVFIPFVFVDVETEGHYTAKYGITHTVRYGRKAHQTITTWYKTSSDLPLHHYSEKDGFKIYTGYTYDINLVAVATHEPINYSLLQPFNNTVNNTVNNIDPFLMKQVDIDQFVSDKIDALEEQRALDDIYNVTGSGNVDKLNLTINWDCELHHYLLPVFVHQVKDEPPRILPAYYKSNNVCGVHSISVSKTMFATMAMTTILSIAFPQFAIPLRLFTVASGISAGVYAQLRLKLINNKQHLCISQRKNEEVDITEVNNIINNHIFNQTKNKDTLIKQNGKLTDKDVKLMEKEVTFIEQNGKLMDKDVKLMQKEVTFVEKDLQLIDKNLQLINDDIILITKEDKIINQRVHKCDQRVKLIEKDVKLIDKNVREIPPIIINHLQQLGLTENDLSENKIIVAHRNINKSFKNNRDMIRCFQDANESKKILINYVKNNKE